MRIVVTKDADGVWGAHAQRQRPGERSFPIVAGVTKAALKAKLRTVVADLEAAKAGTKPAE